MRWLIKIDAMRRGSDPEAAAVLTTALSSTAKVPVLLPLPLSLKSFLAF
jgi:hypothetical protein